MNEHERQFVLLLRNALEGDVEKGIKEFEAYYWAIGDVVSWDSELGRAIHELASEIEYFEPKKEWRTYPILYDHNELRRRIRQVLALAPSD